ncbi:hypothetical protein I7I48_02271 [Histoplasma ohiense]|nr:hypothetical protein I7I48_02271 [Histoplasma ohiense (nom. inval.)]
MASIFRYFAMHEQNDILKERFGSHTNVSTSYFPLVMAYQLSRHHSREGSTKCLVTLSNWAAQTFLKSQILLPAIFLIGMKTLNKEQARWDTDRGKKPLTV